MKTRLLCRKVRLNSGGYAPEYWYRYFGANNPDGSESLYVVEDDNFDGVEFYRAASRFDALAQHTQSPKVLRLWPFSGSEV